MDRLDKLINDFRSLDEWGQRQVVDYIEFLKWKQEKKIRDNIENNLNEIFAELMRQE